MALFVHMLFPVRRRFWPGWTSFSSPWRSPSDATRPTSGHGSTKWIQSRYCRARRQLTSPSNLPVNSFSSFSSSVELAKVESRFQINFCHLHYSVTYCGCGKKLKKQPQITLHVCRIILQRKLEKLSAKKVSRQLFLTLRPAKKITAVCCGETHNYCTEQSIVKQ